MRRTVLRIEKQDGEPLEVEVNGRLLTGGFERGVFYGAVALLALGALWVTVAVVLPMFGVVLTVLVSIVGVGILVVIIALVMVFLWVVVRVLLERSSERRRRANDWEE